MIYAMPATSYGLPCVELCDGDEPLPEGAAYPVPADLDWVDMIIDNGTVREKTTEEKLDYVTAVHAAVDAEEADRQLAKLDDLKRAENAFLALCDSVTGQTTHIKLSIPQLNAIGATITDPQVKAGMTLTLLAIDAQLKTMVGNGWWFDCQWHPEVA